MNDKILTEKRKELVRNNIAPLNLEKRILKAFLQVPRHLFVPENYRDSSYEDNALPIGFGQTISQPSLVALMTSLLDLKGDEKVLEIGTGSGYQAAILSRLAGEVFTVERIPGLADKAKETLENLGLKNIHVYTADGSLGLPKFGPYDAIIVTAAAKEIPDSLVRQLKNGGRIIIPVGEEFGRQELLVGEKSKGKLKIEKIEAVRFVPLITNG